MPTTPAKPAFPLRPGFTLIELMLSIAMVLVLIIGINFVFRAATDTVGAGNVINAANSDSQAAQGLLFDDFRNVVKDPSCFVIASQIVPQFLNAADAQVAANVQKPLLTVTDNAGTQYYFNEGLYNYRSHRADLVRFFARGFYPRRTAPDGTFTSSTTADDAFITLGHVALPYTNGTGYCGPTYDDTQALERVGAYASDWVLGRSVMLLKDPTIASTSSTDYYYARQPSTPLASPPYSYLYTANLTPLGYNSPDSNPTAANSTQVQSSRYDIAGLTIEQCRSYIANEILKWRTPSYTETDLWWNPLIYSPGLVLSQIPPSTNSYLLSQSFSTASGPPYTIHYYSFNATNGPLYTSAGAQTPGGPALPLAADSDQYMARQEANPLIQQPLTAAAISGMSPYFLQHCSQFIVEYAGDYMQQDAEGDMTGIGPDGQIDYYLDASGNKHIRWYGMPRSTTGATHADGFGADAIIRGYDQGKDTPVHIGTTYTFTTVKYFTDVIPLRDYYTMYFNGVNGDTLIYSPPWEVDVNFAPYRDYGTTFNTTGTNIAPSPDGGLFTFGDPSNPSRYACAWYNDMPAMIRILIKVDDPNNQVKDGPWYEYIFRLK